MSERPTGGDGARPWGSARTGVSRPIRVSFGDGHQLEISQNGSKTTIRFVGRQKDLVLDASDKGCEFERGVNIMRLYMGKT
jgi:hypothetical protein